MTARHLRRGPAVIELPLWAFVLWLLLTVGAVGWLAVGEAYRAGWNDAIRPTAGLEAGR